MDRLQGFHSHLGVGPIHGDFTLNNIIVRSRRPLLVDIDEAAVGPREWDLALLSRAKGWRADEWPAFSEGYGHDLLSREENDVLREQAHLKSLLRMLSSKAVPLPLKRRGRRLLEEWMQHPERRCFELDWTGQRSAAP
jgi:Ser/Thr protein kinase RdoA (MazF antagonist)